MDTTPKFGELTDKPVCPHCGNIDDNWWDGIGGDKGDGDRWVTNCPNCALVYCVLLQVEYSFKTRKEIR